jgi:germacradienol/geosmin synthase
VWHLRSCRYINGAAGAGGGPAHPVLGGPTGLGTSAARLSQARSAAALVLGRLRRHAHVPYRPIGPVALPEFTMPFPTRVNPHLDAARANVMAWSRAMGFLTAVPDAPGVPGSGIWDARKLAAFDFAVCAAMIDPDATGAGLDLSTGWLTWGTYADDYVPAVYGRTRDLAGARLFTERLPAFMPLDLAGAPAPANPVERGLADLWARTAAPMSDRARGEFRRAVETMTASWLWELDNHVQHRIPDPIDYVEMRRRTFGSDLTMRLARLSREREVPPEVYATRPLRALENAAADYACLANDVFSYQKEIRFEGELNNGVLVVQDFLGCGLERAVAVVNDLMTARLRQFEHVATSELPILFDELGLDRRARAALTDHVAGMRDWMAAVLRWHQVTRRYDEAELLRPANAAAGAAGAVPRPAPSRPTGLGTAAARLAGATRAAPVSPEVSPGR